MEPPPYRGIHTSLYHTLPADAIQHLEKAIWLKIIGRTTEARAIYQNELSPFENVPVVIVELEDLVHEAGRWGEAWRILNKGLAHAEESNQDLDRSEYRLMALTRAMLGTRHRGDIESSAREVARTQRWLQGVPIVDYTDIQLYSAYENDGAERIPTSESSDAWSGLHELRRSLCARGMIKEANAIFRVELNRTPIEGREPVVEDFLSELSGIPESRDRSYFEAIVRLQWSNTLVMLQRTPRASEEMDLSEAAFNKFCDMYNITDRADTPHMQSLEYERLSCIQDPIEKLSRTESLANRFEQMESFRTGSCLSDAADLAHLFFKFLSDPDYQTKYFDLQTRLERYDETVSEDITDLVQHHNSLISFTLSTSVDRQKSLEWIDGFLERHAYFRAPATLASLYRSQALLFRSLRRMEDAREADRKVAELDAYVPLIGDWIHHRSGPAVVPTREPRDVEEPADDDEVVDEQFFWPWRNAMRGHKGTDTTTMDLVWQWSLEDVAAGRLGVQDFRGMMGITDPDIKLDISPRGIGEIAKALGSERMDYLASAIYPASPEVVASQEAQYERICQWLGEYPRGFGLREKRLFCLVMLRDSRQAHFSQQNMLGRRVRELEKLLELEKTLPRTIRETFPTFRPAWVGAMSMTLVAELGPVADFTGDEPARILVEAERWNENALEEHRRVNDRVSYARFLRSGAQICLMKIFRLQQLMAATTPDPTGGVFIGPSSVPIQELQARGHRNVAAADAILSTNELHASWDDGLDSVAHRQNLSRFYGSAWTAITAITLHLAAAGPQEEVPKTPDGTVPGSSIWRWVQKYKARSLARTIGVRSYEPPELINRILEESETRTLYQEMLDLKRRTDEAELMDRFELRRQMDAHLERIKDAHPLLRQLVDLREATPFAVGDVAALEAQAGCPVVLVDWFYLPPYLANQAGRMLLFTARAGQAPTMDILPVAEADVLGWQDQYLSPHTWKHYREENLNTPEARGKFNAMLGGLVAPLAHRTKRGEVLVLCPSSILHRVPLHALDLTRTTTLQDCGEGAFSARTKTKTKTEALIHRNPIIYTHSHSLLRSCAAAAEYARHDPGALNPTILSGIPEAEAERYGAGRKSIRDLAGGFGVEPMMDAGAGKPEFLKHAVNSRLVHLHTHCNWRAGDPLNHHVEFPRVPDSTSIATANDNDKAPPRPKLVADNDDDETKPNDERPVDRLTARELFEVKLPASTHVNLIACQGGIADVQLGDEVMGLVPALLYAGASSTVSTLWSIDDGDGARFARHFFESFSRQCRRKKKSKTSGGGGGGGGDGVGFVDIAKAVREAAGEMDASNAEPLYTWAAFAMHGFWRFPLSVTDLEGLKSRQG
ncbi:hypothetical protein PG984_010274 [Apiospora sp. TS-2023a]